MTGSKKMQVKELSAEGLKRAYEVVVAADEIEQRVDKRLDELKKTIKVPGFRPGKVPVTLLKKQYGRSVMGEVLEQAVNEGSQQAINDNELKPALRPKIEVKSFEDGKGSRVQHGARGSARCAESRSEGDRADPAEG